MTTLTHAPAPNEAVFENLVRPRDTRPVRYGIAVNVQVRYAAQGTMDRTPVLITRYLHEVPLLRAWAAPNGHSIELLAEWPRGLEANRVKAFSRDDLHDHVAYLNSEYTKPFGEDGEPRNLAEEVYGSGRDSTLFQVMLDLQREWEVMLARVRAEIDRQLAQGTAAKDLRVLTAQDIERVLSAVFVANDTIDLLDALPELEKPQQKLELDADEAPGLQVWSDDDEQPDDEDLTSYLLSQEVPAEVADAFARLYSLHGMDIPDDAWFTVKGVGGHQGKRKRLLKFAQDWHSNVTAAE